MSRILGLNGKETSSKFLAQRAFGLSKREYKNIFATAVVNVDFVSLETSSEGRPYVNLEGYVDRIEPLLTENTILGDITQIDMAKVSAPRLRMGCELTREELVTLTSMGYFEGELPLQDFEEEESLFLNIPREVLITEFILKNNKALFMVNIENDEEYIITNSKELNYNVLNEFKPLEKETKLYSSFDKVQGKDIRKEQDRSFDDFEETFDNLMPMISNAYEAEGDNDYLREALIQNQSQIFSYDENNRKKDRANASKSPLHSESTISSSKSSSDYSFDVEEQLKRSKEIAFPKGINSMDRAPEASRPRFIPDYELSQQRFKEEKEANFNELKREREEVTRNSIKKDEMLELLEGSGLDLSDLLNANEELSHEDIMGAMESANSEIEPISALDIGKSLEEEPVRRDAEAERPQAKPRDFDLDSMDFSDSDSNYDKDVHSF